ncbi:MAG: hypothetical protein K2G67_06835 [Muribaculaceae bacterium]|nr:hypothetical protein [Muribaculaceae bacterium]
MKKISIILGLAAVALGFTSCKQEDEPQYKVPTDNTTFIISTPAMQNVEFETVTENTDPATFNLFCSQPDYGFSAVCEYAAIVSIDPECPVEKVIDEETGETSIQPIEGKSVLLANSTPSSAAMTFKLYDLSLAMMSLYGVSNDRPGYDGSDLAKGPVKAYFRAICKIKGIDNSAIASNNVVSLNAVKVQYTEKLPAWIYILGDVTNLETGVSNGFLAPGINNYDIYKANFAVYEPLDMIGEKLYVGSFQLDPKEAAMDPNTINPENQDHRAQFRFMTELGGWSDTSVMLGSGLDDFWNENITDQWANVFKGTMVTGTDKAKGNWGALITTPTSFTVVVDVPGLMLYVKEGVHTVTFTGRTPDFN